MNTSELSKSYDIIAEKWNADMLTSNYGISMINRSIMYCSKKRTALDVGCGSGGRIINRLLEDGFDITAIDISVKMLHLAKKNHPNVKFIKADIIDWNTEYKFDLIIAWDSIFHLPLEFQKPVVEKLCKFLNPQGVLVYTFGDVQGEHEDIWLNEKFGYTSIGIDENLKILTKNNCQCRHLELDQFPQKHVSIIARKGD